ncbi:Leucyl/phenylalanyl-tRNA--protein transferase [Patescibacteria group bacterium]|nr:Leucyl/phenylalanyl-tRNA--protein transferase [Patescibacteria group bacterium]
MMRLTLLDPYTPQQPFPSVDQALDNPDGLLAVGGCLSTARLLNAYRQGIFPWYNPDEPILWWSPNPRLVLFPEHLNVSRSLRKTLRKQQFSVSFDTAFSAVLEGCAKPRLDDKGTWLSPEMQAAYCELHRLGYAHSIETWLNDELVGGLYGVALGQVFFGESMFHTQTDASKVAFVYLVENLIEWGYQLVDCQVYTEHLVSLGAEEITRREFSKLLEHYSELPVSKTAWQQS